MKKLIFTIAFFTACASMQETPPELANAPIAKVYEFKGMSQAAVFDKSMLWIAESYGSAKSVIQHSDRAQGVIVGQCIGNAFYMMWDRGFTYTLKIEARAGKARFTVDNIAPRTTTQSQINGAPIQVGGLVIKYKEQYDLAAAYVDELARRYETYMRATATF